MRHNVPRLFYAILAIAAVCSASAPPAWAQKRQGVADLIEVVNNLSYRDGVKSCSLDLAFHKDRGTKRRPAIVVIHGGGWVEGDKSSFASDLHGVPGNIVDFAKLGFVAVTINYRLSGEAKFPAAFHDCQCAVRWLRAHADEYHVDPKRIGAYGNSAGGHLALLLGMSDRSLPPEEGGPHRLQPSGVQAAASDSGPIDLVAQIRQGQLKTILERLLGGPPVGARMAEYVRASPASHLSGKISPLLLIYGETDEQVDVKTADQFVAALSRSGKTDVSYIRLAAVGHCPHSLKRVPFLREVVNQFFLRTLGNPSGG